MKTKADNEMIKHYLTYFFQVVKRITDGGADYSFECVGETAVINTALQSCCDVTIRYP